jgi:hypothetical protein
MIQVIIVQDFRLILLAAKTELLKELEALRNENRDLKAKNEILIDKNLMQEIEKVLLSYELPIYIFVEAMRNENGSSNEFDEATKRPFN